MLSWINHLTQCSSPVRRIAAIILFTLMMCPSSFASDDLSNRHILIDAGRSDTDLAVAFTVVAASTQWRTIVPTPQDTLATILAREYNLTADKFELYPETHKTIRNLISWHNKGVDVESTPLKPLQIPPLPSIPNKGVARADLVQLQKGSKYVVVKLGPLLTGHEQPVHKPLFEAEIIAFANTFSEQLNRQNQTPLRRLYTGPIRNFPYRGTRAINSGASDSPPIQTACAKPPVLFNQPAVSPELKQRVSQIPEAAAGDLYILDFDFEQDDCVSHGKKVRDVVTQMMIHYGAEHLLKNHVKVIDVDYYRNPIATRSIVNMIVSNLLLDNDQCDYVRLFAASFNVTLDTCGKKISDIQVQQITDSALNGTVPGFYLWLLFQYVTDPSSHASVVTSSFFAPATGFDIATSELRQWPALVAAVLNPDRCTSLPCYANELTSDEQPQRQFFDKKESHGTFLIGATLEDGSPFGMTSSRDNHDLDAVTAFASGEGYGTLDPGTGCLKSCINPKDKGTSFAAPAVAVQLYLARALWRVAAFKNDEAAAEAVSWQVADPVSVIDARRRLALSADVDPNLVGKAGAAGLARFDRLVADVPTDADIIVAKDGAVKTGMNLVADAHVKVNNVKMEYGDKEHEQGFGGLQVHDGHPYVYVFAKRAWVRADDSDFFVAFQDGTHYSDTESFSKSYNSIARY